MAWMDQDNLVDGENAFGCMPTHNIIHPDHVIVLDGVGCNTSQKGDGQIGGELMLYKTDKMPQHKINIRNKYCTCLELTALSSELVMYCLTL